MQNSIFENPLISIEKVLYVEIFNQKTHTCKNIVKNMNGFQCFRCYLINLKEYCMFYVYLTQAQFSNVK